VIDPIPARMCSTKTKQCDFKSKPSRCPLLLSPVYAQWPCARVLQEANSTEGARPAGRNAISTGLGTSPATEITLSTHFTFRPVVAKFDQGPPVRPGAHKPPWVPSTPLSSRPPRPRGGLDKCVPRPARPRWFGRFENQGIVRRMKVRRPFGGPGAVGRPPARRHETAVRPGLDLG